MTKYNFVAVFNKSENPNSNIFTVTVPDVPGVVTEGAGVVDAINQVEDALEVMLLTLEDADRPINEARGVAAFKDLLKSEEDFLHYIQVDTSFPHTRGVIPNRGTRRGCYRED